MREAKLFAILRASAAFAKRVSTLIRDFEDFATDMQTV